MDKSGVDKLLTKFFIMNNISFNVIQSDSFKNLVKALGEFGPTYRLPSYTTLRTKLIPEAKKEVGEYVKNVKKSWEKTGCTIMSDTWSDLKQRCYINFIAHSPGGAVFLQFIEISKERKTGYLLKELCSKVIDLVGPQYVVQFVTDNASNFESAGEMLVGKYPTMYKTKCAAHGIQLLFKDIYKDLEWVRSAVDDAKSIQSFMYRHQIITGLMRDATNGRELKKPCATRFASNFIVLQSVLEVENALRLFVASPIWRGLEYTKSSEGKRVTCIIQDPDFWTRAKEVIDVLEPLVRILRLVDGDGDGKRIYRL
ncbi:unnamed protein product [Cuscuta epithymum]|uniref:DUF659 domain-containing protein n=1 Tax=Cuscuta epithymum TaxID=186058 RepID=A0AAV0EX92_9ASTE|nr:unnamed protein product [Cuscuta epithymum]